MWQVSIADHQQGVLASIGTSAMGAFPEDAFCERPAQIRKTGEGLHGPLWLIFDADRSVVGSWVMGRPVKH
jgi:hypothetical protein